MKRSLFAQTAAASSAAAAGAVSVERSNDGAKRIQRLEGPRRDLGLG